MTIKHVAQIGAVLLTLGLSSLSFAQVPNDHLIVPGERVGAVRLGMSVAELRSTLGQPLRSSLNGEYATHYYPDQLDVLVRDGTVRVISVGPVQGVEISSPYRTQSALSVGSTQMDVSIAIGAPECTRLSGDDRTEHVYLAGMRIQFNRSVGTAQRFVIETRHSMGMVVRDYRRWLRAGTPEITCRR